jgi:pyruvate kinase
MRRTRILATMGPASRDPAIVRDLIAAGADAFRLNFSHGTHAEHAEAYRHIRAAAAEAGRRIAIVQDLGGPKIRTGTVAAPIMLAAGDTLAIEHGDFVGGPGRVSCTFDALFASSHAGDRLLMDDGRIELAVTSASASRIDARVVVGGELDSHKGINLPGVPIATCAVTPKDEDDLKFGLALGVDFVALSFVQSAADVRRARELATACGAPDVALIAKIERPQALDHLEEILDVVDAVMVARGDLGIEVPLETLPALQRRLVTRSRARGVPVIVATEVLESMRHEPRPTRAEVTDAAHAVDEGADVIMLSGETAMGDYPVRTVQTLTAIISAAEASREATPAVALEGTEWSAHGLALCEAALTLAERAQASAIVAVTAAGNTARLLAALRPRATIVAATPNERTAAQLSLVWGITPVVTGATTLDAVRDAIRSSGAIHTGETVVFVSMETALGVGNRNFLRIEKIA